MNKFLNKSGLGIFAIAPSIPSNDFILQNLTRAKLSSSRKMSMNSVYELLQNSKFTNLKKGSLPMLKKEGNFAIKIEENK
jgi:hypothetical protein